MWNSVLWRGKLLSRLWSKPWLHAGMWCRLKLLLSLLQRNDLLRCVHASGSTLTIENAGVSRHCWLIWIGRLSDLILLLLDTVLKTVRVTDLTGCGLHRHGLSGTSLVRNRLHGSGVMGIGQSAWMNPAWCRSGNRDDRNSAWWPSPFWNRVRWACRCSLNSLCRNWNKALYWCNGCAVRGPVSSRCSMCEPA